MTSSGVGKALLVAAALLAVAGAVLLLLGSTRLPFGRLPGDLSFRKGSLRVYVPLATSLVLSIALTVVLNLVLRRR